MHAVTGYEDLQDALLTRCTKRATFLFQRDWTAWPLDAVPDPERVQRVVMVPSEYGAFPNLFIAVFKRKCEQMTLLLPFRGHFATSINIWKPFWDIDTEFSVRIGQLGWYQGVLVYVHMERAYFSVSQNNGKWEHSLQQLSDSHTLPLADFERAADTFVQLLSTL